MKYKLKRIAALTAVIIIITASLISPGAVVGAESEAAVPAALMLPAARQTRDLSKLRLYPGGMPFGVKFYTEGVLVVGFCDIDTDGGKINPAYAAGIRLKDVITAINGEVLTDAQQMTSKIDGCEGREISVTYRRDGSENTVMLTPIFSAAEGRYKTGVWVRDSGAGIGTVTFIDPDTNAFGGLGHGICDGDTGELTPMLRGTVTTVTISGLTRGIAGDPGEVRGYFNPEKCGTLLKNTQNGVFGVLTEIPAQPPEPLLPVASRNEIRSGDAYIWCTLDNNEIGKYSIRISDVDTSSESNKCFTVTVTDPALLEKTGGIIQGMSGSPIIQNGKIVGAVTHVLINDPSRGYGIFIENMLDSMTELLR